MRKLLWALLALVPATVAARLLGLAAVPLFALGVLALVPLAWTISLATEQAGRRTGPAIGGFLNATFANVPELLISLFALSEGLFEVVRGSLSGSVLGNLLLVLGLALIVGGEGRLDRSSVRTSLALVAVTVPFLAAAALAHRVVGEEARVHPAVTLPGAAVLVALYAAVTLRTLRQEHREAQQREEAEWSLPRSLVTLGVATVATAAVSETITGSIAEFADALHLSEFFAAAVIVAVAGNAAEHGAAVVIAARGELELAADVALESAAQVAALAIPAVAALSWLVNPLPPAFTAVELVALAAAVALAIALLFGARATRGRGALLVTAYVAVVVTFLVAG